MAEIYTTPKGGIYGGTFDSTGLDPNVRAVMMDNRWTTTYGGAVAVTQITYAFPTSASDYTVVPGYPDEGNAGTFKPVTAAQQVAVQAAFGLVASYTNLTFVQVSSGLATDAAFRFSIYGNGGSVSNFPANSGPYSSSDSRAAGDTFLGGNGAVPTAFFGTDGFNTIIHEMGHAFGLKHGHDPDYNGALAPQVNDNEFSVMTYASYFGADTAGATEAWVGSAPQSYMMYDIAALQAYYGANFSGVGTSATYTWDASSGQQYINNAAAPDTGVTATNKIFSTVWAQGATTTYDLSDFQGNQVDDMRPGHWMNFSASQIADLNSDAPQGTAKYQAQGNIYNALLYNNDTRSEISNLVAGSGNDTVMGNDLDNVISGNGGNDKLNGGGGNDRLYGGDGDDTLVGGTATTGQSQLWGGNGTDTADYSAQTAVLDIDLAAGAGYVTRGGVLVLTDQLNSIENVIGGSGNDTLVGDAAANRLNGGAGTDALYGLDGNDTLVGGTSLTGQNQLWGGNGFDTVDYSAQNDAVYVDLGAGVGYVTHTGKSDQPVLTLADLLNSIENAIGGAGNDTLIGYAGIDRFDGGAGADGLYGNGGTATFIYKSVADSNLTTGYDTIADFIVGTDKIDLTAFHTDASHLFIDTAGTTNSIYLEQTPGTFNTATDTAISVITTTAGGLHASDFIF
jgi:Ca2+-binding RTX toxin-like protein